MLHATASLVLWTASTTCESVVDSGWSTLIPAATWEKVAIRASRRWNDSTRSVASVTMSTTPTTRPSPNSGANTTSQYVSVPGIAIRCAACRITRPESAVSTSSCTASSLPGISSLRWRPGAVYSAGTPR